MATIHEDGLLVVRIREGDLSALGALYDKYRLQVFHTALAITADHQIAEDILQEAFLRLYSYADRIDLSVPVAPWLYRVTVNLSHTWVTRQANRWTSLDSLINWLVAPALNSPERQFEARDLRTMVWDALEGLPFNQRVVVILHYLNGLNLKEIAYILDCPVGTAKSRLFYGRQALRRQLMSRLEQVAVAPEVTYDLT
jgi:RNA polymerase sigma-70 factor (ECF subfamily)